MSDDNNVKSEESVEAEAAPVTPVEDQNVADTPNVASAPAGEGLADATSKKDEETSEGDSEGDVA